MCLLAHSSVQCMLCFAFLRLVYPMFPFSLDYPFCIASSVISNVYVCNNEEKNDFLYDKLNKSYTYMTEISYTQIQMHKLRMGCWPASLEEMKLLLFDCTLSICFVYWQKTSHVENYLRFNDECTHMCYWKQYLHYGVCQISMSDLMMNIHTFVTDNTTYTKLHVRSVYLI